MIARNPPVNTECPECGSPGAGHNYGCSQWLKANRTERESDAKVIAALKGAFLAHLMRENECYCFQNGVPCDAKKCGCLMELQAAVDEQTAGESK